MKLSGLIVLKPAMRNAPLVCVVLAAFTSPAAAGYAEDCLDFKHPDKAIQACTVMLKVDPRTASIYAHRGSAYITKQDYDSAIRDLGEAIRLDPRQPSFVYSLRGVAYQNKGENDQAIADFSEAIRLDPTMVQNYSFRGQVYRDKEANDLALADFNKAMTIEGSAQLYLDRGTVYYAKNDLRQSHC